MTDVELSNYLKNSYNIEFPVAYIHFVNNFIKLDKNLKNTQTHHICPRCCGGKDEPFNLAKITFNHHRKLHQLILKTEGLNEEQRKKLKFAYKKMRGELSKI